MTVCAICLIGRFVCCAVWHALSARLHHHGDVLSAAVAEATDWLLSLIVDKAVGFEAQRCCSTPRFAASGFYLHASVQSALPRGRMHLSNNSLPPRNMPLHRRNTLTSAERVKTLLENWQDACGNAQAQSAKSQHRLSLPVVGGSRARAYTGQRDVRESSGEAR